MNREQADHDLREAVERRLAERREDARRRRAARERARRAKTARRTAGLEARHRRKLNRISKEKTMTETTTHPHEVGDLVHLTGSPGACSHCGTQITAALGVVVENGIYGTTLVDLVDRSFPAVRSTVRVCCGTEELEAVDMPDVIHASPEDVAAAVSAGHLPPGSEFYGCEFRIVQTRKPA